MAVAAWCRQCGAYVYLTDQWGCVNGHAWTEASNWYDPATGSPVAPYWLAPGYDANVAAQTAAAASAVAQPAPIQQPAPVAQAAPVAAQQPAPVAQAEQPAPVAQAAQPAPVAQAEQPAPVAQAAPTASRREAFLADLLATFAQYPTYAVAYGTDTDVSITTNLVDASWGLGSKKVDYSAILKTVEPEMTVYFWELLKEQSSGLSFGSADYESTTTFGKKRSGVTKQAVMTPNGPVEMEWDYGQTRAIVESVAARHGLAVKVVLRKKSAQW